VGQALSIATYLFVGRPGEFYLLAVAFGTAYGGVMRCARRRPQLPPK
jgi:hypothetical protein